MRNIWKAIGIILALMAIYLAAQSLVTFVIGIIGVLPVVMQDISSGAVPDVIQMTEKLMRAVSAQTPLILFVSIAIAIPSYYLIYRSRKQELLTFVSVRGIGAVSVPVLVIFGVSMNFLIEWLLSLASQLGFLAPVFEKYEHLAQFITGGDFVLSLLAVGIIGPIFEEILFRGLIFGELRKITKVRVALLLQALLFGAFHMNVIQSSYAFIIGILLGFVYYRSNSILAPMLVHITINSSTVLLTQFVTGSDLDTWTVVIIAASTLLFVATGAFILLSRNFKRTMNDSLYEINQAPKLQPPEACDL